MLWSRWLQACKTLFRVKPVSCSGWQGLSSMSLKTWMDWLALFLPYLGNPFCFWFSPSRQLSHMKTSFQLRRRRPQSIILIFSLWSTAPPSSERRMGTTAPVLWSLFAQNRRQLSAIIVRKLPAQICNYWPLIVMKFTTNARWLTPFDKKLASMSFYFSEVPRSSERHLFHVQKSTFSGYMFLHLVKFFWNHFQSIKLFVNNGGDPHHKRKPFTATKIDWWPLWWAVLPHYLTNLFSSLWNKFWLS